MHGIQTFLRFAGAGVIALGVCSEFFQQGATPLQLPSTPFTTFTGPFCFVHEAHFASCFYVSDSEFVKYITVGFNVQNNALV